MIAINLLKVDKISSLLISAVVMGYIFQFVLETHGISFNLIYANLVFLFAIVLINRFRLAQINSLILILIVTLIFCMHNLIFPTDTLNFYIREFIIYALPLLVAFSFKVDWTVFLKSMCVLSAIGLILLSSILFNTPGEFEDYMALGYYGIFCSVLLLIYGYIFHKPIIFVTALIFSLMVILNGNRGTLLVVLVALVACFCLAPASRLIRHRRIVLVTTLSIFALALSSIIISYVVANLEPDSYSTKQFIAMFDSKDVFDALGERGDIYLNGLDEIRNHPLAGIGIGGFEQKYGIGIFPHNIVLDTFITFGIPFGMLILIVIFVTIKRMYKKMRDNKNLLILFIFTIAICMKLLLSKVFIYDPFFWLLIAIGIAVLSEREVKYDKTT